MILFRPQHVPLILKGIKTQTRRIGKRRWRLGSIHQAKTSLKKGSKPFALIRIVDIRQEKLGNITEEDVHKEGYQTIEEYKQVFKEIYGFWDPGMPVWVIDFEVIDSPEEEIGNEYPRRWSR